MSGDTSTVHAVTSSPVGAIWAQDRRGVIGAAGRMLWRVPADFHHFRAATMGCVVIMGRTTWESIGGALDGRMSIVLTRRKHWAAPGALVTHDLHTAIASAREAVGTLGADSRTAPYRTLPRVWVIGGGTVYRQALEGGLVDELLITLIDLDAGACPEAAGMSTESLVRAPALDPARWELNGPNTDPPNQWRPISGDSAWRVEHWRHARA